MAARERLIKALDMLLISIQELKEMGLKEEEQMIRKACNQSLSSLEKAIKALDKDL